MMKLRGFFPGIALIVATVSFAHTMFPDSKSASNSVELTVEGIDRICPTGMWDHWIFREIEYDKETNTVVWVIQSSHSVKNAKLSNASSGQFLRFGSSLENFR